MPVSEHPLREGVRDNSNHYVTGRDGGRDIDLRRFAVEGMELFGILNDYDEGEFHFSPNLSQNLKKADNSYNNINKKIDAFIDKNNIDAPKGHVYKSIWEPQSERESLSLNDSGITTVIWCIGFQPNFKWIDLPVFNEQGYPQHERGITANKGLYFIGLPWLHTWGSARFSGIAKDAEYICSSVFALNSLPKKISKLQTA